MLEQLLDRRPLRRVPHEALLDDVDQEGVVAAAVGVGDPEAVVGDGHQPLERVPDIDVKRL